MSHVCTDATLVQANDHKPDWENDSSEEWRARDQLGEQVTLWDCPAGAFAFEGQDGKLHVGFKSEYGSNSGIIDAYNEAGEYFALQHDLVWPLDIHDLLPEGLR